MAKRKLDQFTYLSQLLPAASDIVVANLVEIALFILALDRLTLTMDDSILSNNTILWRIYLDNFEFDLSHPATHSEEIPLSNGSIGLTEVGSKEDVEKGTR
jgi:hypothetical protein